MNYDEHISINQQQLQLKTNIVKQLLTKSSIDQQRQVLSRWPSQQLKKYLNEIHIIKSSQNIVYYGEMVNEILHGYGLMVYEHPQIRFYQGQFQNNCKHGYGIQFINGDLYIGCYVNNKPEDKSGVFIWNNGDKFIGSFLNGIKHGKGRWISGKDTYCGDWKFNNPDGQGIIQNQFSVYEGSVKNGYKHGMGSQLFVNGDKYEGNYVTGKPQGQGTYYWNNGAIYKGQFKNGMRCGYGEWKYGFQRYQGYYTNDKRNGFGLYSWEGGGFYKGEFKDDLRHGYGEMHWSQNCYYKGEWKEGSQNGKGQFWDSDKLVKNGIYSNGNFMQNAHNEDIKGKSIKQETFKNKDKHKQSKNKLLNIDRKSIGVRSALSNYTGLRKKTQIKIRKDLSHKKNSNQESNIHRYAIKINTKNKEYKRIGNKLFDNKKIEKRLPIISKVQSDLDIGQDYFTPIKWENLKKRRPYGNYSQLPNLD